jgi:pimeloyl-ACP methyl ester carboxylesterase
MAKPLPPIVDFLDGAINDLEAGKLDESRTAIRTPALDTGHPDQQQIERRVVASQAEVSAEDVIAQCQFIIDNMDQMDELPEISTPTLFVHARNDGYFDLDLTNEIAERVPGSRLVVVEDTGHLMALEQPAALTALIRLWLST